MNLAHLASTWSDPEVLIIEDIPPPSNITSELIIAKLVTNDNGILAYTFSIDVSWVTIATGAMTPLPMTTSPPPAVPEGHSRKKRGAATIREAEGMEVTLFTIAAGFEEIMEPYGEIPEQFVKKDVLVRKYVLYHAAPLAYTC